MGIKSNLNRLNRLLNHHIGLGGDAHAEVNDWNAGFMTPDLKNDLENAEGIMKTMPAGTDVFELPAGNYEISGANNNPIGDDDHSFIEYYITTASENRRQIRAIVSNSGRKYFRTIHTGGDVTSGTGKWRYEPYQIWNGSATTGTLTFDPSSVSFKFQNGIRVRYLTKTYQVGTCDIMGTSTGVGVIDAANIPDNQNIQIQVYEMAVSFTTNNLTIDHNKTVNCYPGGISAGEPNFIMITGVFAI